MPLRRLTPELIAAAIEGYEAQKSRIDGTIAELRAMLPGGHTEAAATPAAPKQKRRKMSAAARRRIAEAQRKRWAEAKKATEPAPQGAPKPKRKLSAAGKRRIIAATKKRWAAVRAARESEKAAVTKKTSAKKTPAGAAKKAGTKRPKKTAPLAPQVATEAAG
jgi:hypothetical protein